VIPAWLPELLAAVLAAVLAITLHEAAHGYAALALGDDTAKQAGRLSLNPIRHVDPIGTLVVPGVLLIGQLATLGHVQGMFGWAKPVPVAFGRLRPWRVGMIIVAAAGPLTNFLLAILAGFANAWFGLPIDPWFSADSTGWDYGFLVVFILVNLLLGLFNLLPIPPLDGGRIVTGLLPLRLAIPLMRMERLGILIVLGLVFILPQLDPDYDPVGWALTHVVVHAFEFVLGVTGNLT